MLFLIAVITIPLGLDLYLPVPEANPLTAEKIEQGRRLFFDRRLSRDSSTACASCHDPKLAFSDDPSWQNDFESHKTGQSHSSYNLSTRGEENIHICDF
jgi:cytochrome c peroxidase